jgi:hypothetical protein
MLVWRLNLAWKGRDPNQCLRLGDDAKTDRTLGARFRESASHGSPLIVSPTAERPTLNSQLSVERLMHWRGRPI